MNQYSKDLDRFAELLAKFTGISKSKINRFLDYNSVSTIFEHPASLSSKPEHINKINDLKLLRNCYLNLKSHDIEYVLSDSSKAGDYFVNFFMDYKDKEKFVCSFLDIKNRVIATSVISEGTVNSAFIFPRELLKKAISYDACSVILSHNHPGGSTNPSKEDVDVTNRIVKVLSAVDIKVLDHIIVGGDRYLSMAEGGYINTQTLVGNRVIENGSEYGIKGNNHSLKKRKRQMNYEMQL